MAEIRKSESAWWSRPLGFIIWVLICLLSLTLRKSVRCENAKQEVNQDKQFIAVLWHNRTLIPCHIFRYMMQNPRPMCMITSASKDGGLLSHIVSHFNMSTVRGSSHRRGATAVLGLLKALKRGSCMCIASDGPRGPMYKSKPGVVKLSSLSGVPIVPACINFSSYWRIKSWDKFIIPKPFSKVELYWREDIVVPPHLSDEEEARYLALVDQILCTGSPDFDSIDQTFPKQ